MERTRSNEMVHEIVYETVNICEPERGVEYVKGTFEKCMYLDFTFYIFQNMHFLGVQFSHPSLFHTSTFFMKCNGLKFRENE